MAAALSQDLRKRLVQAVSAGSTARDAARRFKVSAFAAIKMVRRVRETGSTAPGKIGSYQRPLLDQPGDLLRELTTAKSGITLAELQAALAQQGIIIGSLNTIWTTLRGLGPTPKKTRPAKLTADFLFQLGRVGVWVASEPSS